MPSLRPILLVAAVALWSAAACAAADDDTFLPPAPPGAASPFPFCPTRPAEVSTLPFPWSPPQSPPPPTLASPVAVYPQDPGYSKACRSSSGAAWLPLATVLSAFFFIIILL